MNVPKVKFNISGPSSSIYTKSISFFYQCWGILVFQRFGDCSGFLLIEIYKALPSKIFVYILIYHIKYLFLQFQMSQKRTQRINSPFSKQQEAWCILQFGLRRSIISVRRDFQNHFKVYWRNVPDRKAFSRLINRFQRTHGQVRPAAPGGCVKKYSQEDIDRVNEFFRQDDTKSLRLASRDLGMKVTTIWRILRKELNWKSYKERHVQQLSQRHKIQRMAFCKKMEEMGEQFPRQIIFSDEKWFTLVPHPNKQNTRIWSPCQPNRMRECRVQGAKKVMAWVGVVGNKVLPIHWFEEKKGVNGEAYLHLLVEDLWPAVKSTASRKSLYFMQDGASPHTTGQVMEFLNQKFQGRVISRKADFEWPAKSPDLNPLDYWFWGHCEAEVMRTQPLTLDDLKEEVESFARTVLADTVERSIMNVNKRIKMYKSEKGGHFEHKMTRKSKDVDE